MGGKVQIREFNEDKDVEMVMKLESNCEATGSNKGISIINYIEGDPLYRIRFYHAHVMLVAELQKNGEVVGMVRGCIKYVGTRFRPGEQFKLGSILGLRVSPSHRRMGIGFSLVQSIEEWMKRNGAQYTFLAIEEKNAASKNLFTLRCNYTKSSSLVMYLQSLTLMPKDLPQHIKIERLSIDQAIHLYREYNLKSKDMYPMDIDTLLREKLNLGTWVSYFKEENLEGLTRKEKSDSKSICALAPSSWAMFSLWNTCEAFKVKTIKRSLHETLIHAWEKVFPCLGCKELSLEKPFGFLFLYGIHGEGERIGEIMEYVWGFASRVAQNMKDCKAIMFELGISDPLRELVAKRSTISCMNDLWYLKRVGGGSDAGDLVGKGTLGNVFVDPRDF
ncbi:Peptide alpha-N-acetyltransferase [Bertholletia excelsa]